MTRSTLQATAAFYDSHPLTRLLRWALSTFQRVWPRLAVRTSTRLFLTPLPLKWLHRGRRWESHWQIQSWPFENASVTLYRGDARANPPDSAPAPSVSTVLLVHGWGGHAGQMLALAETLRAKGLQTVILELPAHGRSAGAVSTLPQFARAMDYVAARLGQSGTPLRAVIAHSLGANAAAYAASRGLATERLVLLAPPASPREYTRLFAQVFGLSETTRAALQHRLEAREGILMPLFEPQAVGPRIAQPVLIVHDTGDTINLFADGQAYQQAIRGARLVKTSGLGHRKILKDDAVQREVAIFVTSTESYKINS